MRVTLAVEEARWVSLGWLAQCQHLVVDGIPSVCACCGEPANVQRVITLRGETWMTWFCLLFVFAMCAGGLLGNLFVWAVLRSATRHVSLKLPLCRQHQSSFDRRQLIEDYLLLIAPMICCMPCGFLGFVRGLRHPSDLILFLLAICSVGLLVIALVYLLRMTTVRLVALHNDRVVLSGVSSRFAARCERQRGCYSEK